MDKTAVATKQDIEDLTVVITDAMQIMSDMLVKQDEKIESLRHSVGTLEHSIVSFQESTEINFNRIENKLDPTIDMADSHETHLKRLEQAAA